MAYYSILYANLLLKEQLITKGTVSIGPPEITNYVMHVSDAVADDVNCNRPK